MGRAFSFNEETRQQAYYRQHGKCAHCGDGLEDQLDNGHHVLANQEGDRRDKKDQFLRKSDNCVMLCEPCHEMAHGDRKYASVNAPPEWFPYSHGGDPAEHKAWADRVNAEMQRLDERKVDRAEKSRSAQALIRERSESQPQSKRTRSL